MRIFGDISANGNKINQGKTEAGTDIKSIVNKEQLDLGLQDKIDKSNTTLAKYKYDLGNNNVLDNQIALPTGLKYNSKTGKFGNTTFYTIDNNVFINHENVSRTQNITLNISSVCLMGPNILAVSSFQTVPTIQGKTELFNLSDNSPILLPSQIDTTERHFIKFLPAINKFAFLRLDIPKVFLITMDNIYSEVINVEEFTLGFSDPSTIIEASKTELFAMGSTTTSVINLSDGTSNTALNNIISPIFAGKQVFSMEYTSDGIIVSCKIANPLFDFLVKIKQDGTIVQLPYSTTLSVLQDNTEFDLIRLGNNLIVSKLSIFNGTGFDTQLDLFDTLNNRLLSTNLLTDDNAVCILDGLFNSTGMMDYAFNYIDGEVGFIYSGNKPMILTDDFNYGDYDVLNFIMLKNYLDTIGIDITDNGFFLKTISEQLDSKSGRLIFENIGTDDIIIDSPVALNDNYYFENCWAKITMSNNNSFFINVDIRKESSDKIRVTDINKNSFFYKDIKTITVAGNIFTATSINHFELDRKTNGHKFVVIPGNMAIQDIENIVVTSGGYLEDMIISDEQNYKYDMILNDCQILVTQTGNNISSEDLYLFTNLGNDTQGSNSTKKGSNKNILFASGNDQALMNMTSQGNGIMFLENGLNGSTYSQFFAAIIGASKISRIMKSTGVTVFQAIHNAIKTSNNPIHNDQVGYGSIDVTEAIDAILDNPFYKALANQNRIPMVNNIDEMSINTLLPKSMIFGSDNNQFILSVQLIKPVLTPTSVNNFIVGSAYVITELTAGDDFSNIGFEEIGKAFIATGNTAATMTTSVVNSFQNNNIIHSSTNYKDQILDFYYDGVNENWKLVSDKSVLVIGNSVTRDLNTTVFEEGEYIILIGDPIDQSELEFNIL